MEQIWLRYQYLMLIADRYTHVAQAATYTSGTKLTYSWYRKRLSTPVVSTYTGDLDIKGLINCTQVGDTIQIETNINGYDRFSATFSLDFSLNTDYTNAYLRGYFGEIIGTGNSSIAYFGHQVEVGEYATSYIPTSGVAVNTFSRDRSYFGGFIFLHKFIRGCFRNQSKGLI